MVVVVIMTPCSRRPWMTKMVMGDEHDHVADDVGADDDDDDDDDGDDGDPGTLSRCSGQSRGKCSAGRGKRWQGEAKREVVDRTSRRLCP